MRRGAAAGTLAVVLTLATPACAPDRTEPADGTESAGMPEATAPAGPTPVGAEATGEFRYGMRVTAVDSASCAIAPLPLVEGDTISAMFVDRRLVRVDVRDGGRATREGVRIGSTEEDVRTAYGDAVEVLPHKYTDGHYLTVAGADSTAYVFETDGVKVTVYRAGLLPWVAWIEGCA